MFLIIFDLIYPTFIFYVCCLFFKKLDKWECTINKTFDRIILKYMMKYIICLLYYLLIVQDGMNIDHTYYDTTYFIKKKEKKRIYNVLMYCMLLPVMSNFFSYIKAMKQKEIKAPIIYITVRIPTSIQRNRYLKQKEVT